MVIPVVRQEDAGRTQGITDNCPEWGIYVEGLRGTLLPLTRSCKTHGVLQDLANSLYTSFGNRAVGRIFNDG